MSQHQSRRRGFQDISFTIYKLWKVDEQPDQNSQLINDLSLYKSEAFTHLKAELYLSKRALK